MLFGSQATGRTHLKSDIDVGVMSKSVFDLSALTFDLCELFKRPDVEVIDLTRASPTLWHAIIRDGKLLYERVPNLFFKFKIYATKIWMETKWLRDRRDQKLIAWANRNSIQYAN